MLFVCFDLVTVNIQDMKLLMNMMSASIIEPESLTRLLCPCCCCWHHSLIVISVIAFVSLLLLLLLLLLLIVAS